MSRIPLSPEDRDLNKQVALALGWKEVRALKIQSRSSLLLEGISPHIAPSPGSGFRAKQYVPNFAGDMNSALELLEELRQRGYHEASLSRTPMQRWECFLEDPLGKRVAEFAEAPARAICLALLTAFGLKVEAVPARATAMKPPLRKAKARSAAGREPRAG